MHRFRFFLLVSGALTTALAIGAISTGCGGVDAPTAADASPPRNDSSAVDPAEAGDALDGTGADRGSCDKYCSLVMESCTEANAQYASSEECLAFCEHIPAEPQSTPTALRGSASLACRQYWADTPAQTNPRSSCLAAGPFGGNVCGDRCTAFCDVLLDACEPGGPNEVYASQSDCASACAGFTYLDAGTDGGGEGTGGPDAGDSLNCRLFHLRAAAVDAEKCEILKPSGACSR